MDFASLIKKGASKNAPRICLIGVEGVGKTTAGAQCPNPIFLCSEDGIVGSGFDDVASYSPKTWEEALQFISWLTTSDHAYQSLIIDTLDWLEPKINKFLCTRDKKENIEDYGYGKGYVVALDEYRKFLAMVEQLRTKKNMLILINAHCQIKNFSNPVGDNYDRYELKVSKQIAGITKEWVDAILFANFETLTVKEGSKTKAKGVGGSKRIVHTTRCAAWDAKNRYSLPDVLPFDMGEILKSMEVGQPDTIENILAEIEGLIPMLEEAKKIEAQKYVNSNKTNATKLLHFLNRLRVVTEGAE